VQQPPKGLLMHSLLLSVSELCPLWLALLVLESARPRQALTETETRVQRVSLRSTVSTNTAASQ
jgi:hypothetical protein